MSLKEDLLSLGNEFDAVAIKQFVKKDKVILEKYVDIRKKNKPKILLKKTTKQLKNSKIQSFKKME